MAVNYTKLFDVAYSTSIPESVKEAVFDRVELPITEGLELSSDICECVRFLDNLAYSNMSEDLANSIIDDVFEGCSEEYIEEVYEAYVQAKSVQYISEADPDYDPSKYSGDKFSYFTKKGTARKGSYGLPMAVRERMRQEAQGKRAAKEKVQKAEARKEAIKGFFNKAKEGVSNTVNAAKNAVEAGKSAANQVKNSAIEAKNKAVGTASATGKAIQNKATEVGTNAKNAAIEAGQKVKSATEPVRDLASYTAHKAVEGGKSFLNKIKGAVGKVKEWGKNYMAQAKAYGDTKRGNKSVEKAETPKEQPSSQTSHQVADNIANSENKKKEESTDDFLKLRPGETPKERLARIKGAGWTTRREGTKWFYDPPKANV